MSFDAPTTRSDAPTTRSDALTTRSDALMSFNGMKIPADVSKWRTPKYCGLSKQTSRIFKVLRFWDECFSWGLSPLKNPHQIPQNCSALLPQLNVHIT